MGSSESSLGKTGSSSTSVLPGFRPQRTRCHDMHDIEVGRQYTVWSGWHMGVLFEWPKIDTYLLAELSARGPNGEAWQTCRCQLTHATSRADLLPPGAKLKPVSPPPKGPGIILAAPSAVCKLAESHLLNGKTYKLFSRNCHLWGMILAVETGILSNVMAEIVAEIPNSFPGNGNRVWRSYCQSNAVELYGILIPNVLPERVRQGVCEDTTVIHGKVWDFANRPNTALLSTELAREEQFHHLRWATCIASCYAMLLPHIFSVDVSEQARWIIFGSKPCIVFRSKLEKLEPVFERVCSAWPSHAPQIDQLRETVLEFAERKAHQAFLVNLRCNDPQGTLQNWAYEHDMLVDNPGTLSFTLKADKHKVLGSFFQKAYHNGGEFIVDFWF